MGDQFQTGETITINVSPREIPPEEQEEVQGILDEVYPGHVLVVPDGSRAWLVREFIDRGVPPEEVGLYLEAHPSPFEITVPIEDLAPPWDVLSELCAELADPATAGDDCTLGSEDDEVPNDDSDLRFYRVRRGFVGDDVEPYTTPSLPVVISRRERRVIAIT